MTHKCPHCEGTGIRIPNYWDDAELRLSCDLAGIDVAPDCTVDRRGAARLVRRSPFTLRNWAIEGTGDLEFIKHRGRYRYSLKAIGDWLDSEN